MSCFAHQAVHRHAAPTARASPCCSHRAPGRLLAAPSGLPAPPCLPCPFLATHCATPHLYAAPRRSLHLAAPASSALSLFVPRHVVAVLLLCRARAVQHRSCVVPASYIVMSRCSPCCPVSSITAPPRASLLPAPPRASSIASSHHVVRHWWCSTQ